MPSSSLSATRSARPPWLAMEGLTDCSSTATTRRASGLVMPLARISGGTLGAASSGVGVLGLTSTRPPPPSSDHSSRAPRRRSTLAAGTMTSSSSWVCGRRPRRRRRRPGSRGRRRTSPSCTPRTSSHRASEAGSGSCPIASFTTLYASGVRVTTGVVVWRSSVVVAMAPVYGVPSTAGPARLPHGGPARAVRASPAVADADVLEPARTL